MVQHFPIGSYPVRLNASAVDRPWYGWCLFHAAEEAKKLGHNAVTAVEMGVAGGNGLVCLCNHRREIEKLLEIEIVLAGFDSGSGLPPSNDPRDQLYALPSGSYEMDKEALEKCIAGRAELVLGDVSRTVRQWEPRADAPLGAVYFDLDFYSSTMSALSILVKQNVLPRIWCYLDDISGYPDTAVTDGIGVPAAIRDFNLSPERQICKDHIMQSHSFRGHVYEKWHDQIYTYHRFTHPTYNVCLANEKHQLRLGI
ncbi:MAG TPA: hypothetical protein VHT24_05610 [Pseudacidobacterium sp.]|nr:hypothetical protein [Pseudacidobacterium sp.]